MSYPSIGQAHHQYSLGFFGVVVFLGGDSFSVVLYMYLFIIYTYANTVSPRALLIFKDKKMEMY